MRSILHLCALMLTVALSSFAQDSAKFYTVSVLASRTLHSGQYSLTLSMPPMTRTSDYFSTSALSSADGAIDRWSSLSFADSMSRPILWKPFDPATIAVQTPLGLAPAAVITAATLAKSHRAGTIGGSVWVGLVGFATAALASAAGVYFGGEWMGGNGSYGSTLVSGLGGLIAGALAVPAIISTTPGDSPLLFGVGIGVFAVAGAIFGYHLSTSPVNESNGRASPSLRPEPKVQGRLQVCPPRFAHQNLRVVLVRIEL